MENFIDGYDKIIKKLVFILGDFMFFRAIEILLSIFTFLGGLQTIIWFLELISPVYVCFKKMQLKFSHGKNLQ